MTDRTPTQVLENGAIRYAVYDEQGNFLRYEYMLPADEPTDDGTPLNKATMLTDETETLLFGNTADRTVNDALSTIADSLSTITSTLDGKLQCVSGQYIGTGTAGSSNKNSLTFPFDPKLVFVTGYASSEHGTSLGYWTFVFVRPSTKQTLATNGFGNGQELTLDITWNSNSLSWCNSDTSFGTYQFNSSGETYYYVAIG